MSTLTMIIEQRSDESLIPLAEPIWRNILEATNRCDYQAFCRDLSTHLQQCVTQERFVKQNQSVSAIDGDISMDFDFLGSVRPGKGVLMVYRVTFEKTGSEALGRMLLGEVNGKLKVLDININ